MNNIGLIIIDIILIIAIGYIFYLIYKGDYDGKIIN